uniref:Uncharacterized protein n=1 Tax=Siphoviridae sp. ctYaH2 TaxID=2825549 RepID=A0A8S5V5P7_9CAUD|nr:MAG TPA: hypothetical protein [Siphoviridae sp. ctYaH2]
MTNEREANIEENVMKISSWYCINLPLAPSLRGKVVVEKRLKDSFLTCWTYGRSGTRVMTLLMYIKYL